MTIVAKIRYSSTDLVFDGTGAWSILNWNAKTSRNGEDVVETMTLRVLSTTDDLLATQVQLFDDLILRVDRYRENPSYEIPVWLHVKRFSETGERRAIIKRLGYEPISSEFNAEAVAHAVRLQVEIVRGGYWEDPTGQQFPGLAAVAGASIEWDYTAAVTVPAHDVVGDVPARIGGFLFGTGAGIAGMDKLYAGIRSANVRQITNYENIWECEDGTNTARGADDAVSETATASPGDGSLLVEDCEDAWDEYVDVDVVSTSELTIKQVGTASAKLAVGAAVAAGDILATEAIASLDISGASDIKFWIRSSVATAAGDLVLLLDEHANCASPSETLAVPALTVDTWLEVTVALTATAAALDAIISVGIKCVVDIGAHNLYIDDIRAVSKGAFVVGTPSASDTWEEYFSIKLSDVYVVSANYDAAFGTFLWLLRSKLTTAANAFAVQLRWGYGGMADADYIRGPIVEVTDTDWDYTEMGVQKLPLRDSQVIGTDILSLTYEQRLEVQVWARRTLGASTIKFDCLCPIAVDEGYMIAKDLHATDSRYTYFASSPTGAQMIYAYTSSTPNILIKVGTLNTGDCELPPGDGRMDIVFARSGSSVLTDTLAGYSDATRLYYERWRSLRGSE